MKVAAVVFVAAFVVWAIALFRMKIGPTWHPPRWPHEGEQMMTTPGTWDFEFVAKDRSKILAAVENEHVRSVGGRWGEFPRSIADAVKAAIGGFPGEHALRLRCDGRLSPNGKGEVSIRIETMNDGILLDAVLEDRRG